MEKEYKISWLKVIGVIALIVIIIVILCLVYPKKDKNNNSDISTTFINNINLMKEAGYDYFKGYNLPDKIGESNEITLEEMITSNLMVEFYDEKGNVCNTEESYIKVTKSLENEYTMKVFLSCDNKSDYIITSIFLDNDTVYEAEDEDDITVEEDSNKVSDDNRNNTTSNSNHSYNSNSGSNSNTSYVKPTINKVTYNISYVDNCKNNCTTSNCTNSCLTNIYHTVIFNSSGGSSVANQIVKHGDKAIYESTVRDGYKFLGWYIDGEKYDFDTAVTKKITLIAKWEKVKTEEVINEYTVKFDSNGGSSVKSQTVLEGDTAYEPNDPTRECYIFAGWYTNSSLTKKYDFNTPVTKNITLYAKWIEDDACLEQYTVKFDSNGGSSIKSQTVLEGNKAYKPNDPTKDCYVFAGWYTNSSLTTKYDFNTPVTKDIILYAKWVDDGSCVETHKVEFDSNGGTYVRTQTVNDGARATLPNDPTKSGYTFLGWYLNGVEFNFNTRIYRDIILEAKWEKDEVKYHTYCEVKEKTYYSTSYVLADQNTWSYNWTIKFEDLTNVDDLKITKVGYLTTLSMYNNASNDYNSGKEITMVNGNSNYDVPITSGTMLKNYSLKSTNFNKVLGSPYYSNGNWYVKATVNIKNYSNVNKYYASNIRSYVYLVPFYFEVSYTNMNKCVDDKASSSSKYENNYKIIETYYK